MKQVVRLAGDDSAVRAIAREAADMLQKDSADRALFRDLWDLHHRRSRFIATPRQRRPVAARDDAPPASRWYRAVWGALLGIGLITALTCAAMLGYPTRWNRSLQPELELTVALIGGGIAILALLLVLLLRVPDASSARYGEVLTVVVGLAGTVLFVYRVVVGPNDSRSFTSADVGMWWPVMGVNLLLLAGIALRCDPVRRKGIREPVGSAASRTVMGKDLRRDAERLAGSARMDRAATAAWNARLDGAERRGVDPESIAQARTMTPTAWLAWLAYDGDIDMSKAVPRS